MRRFSRLLLAMALCVGCAERAAAAPAWKPWGTKPSDACTPFKPHPPHATLDTVCAVLDGLTQAQLDKLYDSAPAPSSTAGFPLRGCTYGCVPGNSLASEFARMPQTNLGWSGKCFGFDIDPATGTPRSLLNAFSPDYGYAADAQADRVKGKLAGPASVYWEPESYSGKALWTFNYSRADPLVDYALKSNIVVSGIRDEIRAISPGFMLGRMYIQTGPDRSENKLVPIYFALFQACTKDGTYATTPGERALPALGGLTLPGGFVF